MRATQDQIARARRIFLIGVTGSGKTTLARAAADSMGVRFVEGDAIGWLPGWVNRPVAEQRSMVADLVAEEGWLFDSAWTTWRDLVLPRTDLIVALDYRRTTSLARLAKRTLVRNVTRVEICNGNTESWRRTFSRDSIIAWHFRSFAEKRADMRAWEVDPQMPPVLRLTSPRHADGWLASLRPS